MIIFAIFKILMIFIFSSLVVSTATSANLEFDNKTNSNANNNKIVDNPNTMTNEYLRSLYDDTTLTNKHLLLQKEEIKKEQPTKETNTTGVASGMSEEIYKLNIQNDMKIETNSSNKSKTIEIKDKK